MIVSYCTVQSNKCVKEQSFFNSGLNHGPSKPPKCEFDVVVSFKPLTFDGSEWRTSIHLSTVRQLLTKIVTFSYGTVAAVDVITRNVLDCDLSNYSSGFLLLAPNTKWIGWPVAGIWPLEIFQDARSVGRSVGRQLYWCQEHNARAVKWYKTRIKHIS